MEKINLHMRNSPHGIKFLVSYIDQDSRPMVYVKEHTVHQLLDEYILDNPSFFMSDILGIRKKTELEKTKQLINNLFCHAPS